MRQIVVTLSDASGGAKNSDPIPLDIHGRPDVSLQVQVTVKYLSLIAPPEHHFRL